jgi:hypothetical protein
LAPSSARVNAWAALGLAALVLVQAAHVQRRKAAQRLTAAVTGSLARGTGPGQLGSTLAIACDANGRLYHLDEDGGRWRLQRFSPDLAPEQMRTGVLPKGVHCAGLAVAPQGELSLAFDDGSVIQMGLASGDQPKAMAAGVLGPVRRYGGDGKGGSWSLSQDGSTLRHRDALGQELALGEDLTEVSTRISALAASADGSLALLGPVGPREQRVRVYRPDGSLRAAWTVPVAPAPVHGLALAGNFILLNDNKQARGLTVYTLDGRYMGQLTHFGPQALIALQGFVGADPYNGDAYVGHAGGLTRFSTAGWKP